MRIVLPSDVEARAADIGPKTRNLQRMAAAGLPVPAFVAIPADPVRDIQRDGSVAAAVSQEIASLLPAKSYAVRSSAIAEDSKTQSFAGQFTTLIDRSAAQLDASIRAVIADAASKGHGERFSVLVQEYVPAAYAGVAFTRSPDGGRHMHIEYHRGIGEDVVSGTVKPSALRAYRTMPAPRSDIPNITTGIGHFAAIEDLFGFAQDIEWCVDARGAWHLLQARPLTTITDAQFAACQYLDEKLPKSAFLYEKTEISEIAPRPTPVTLSLLRRIYAAGGPVERAYASFGVRYLADDVLRIIGNELFLDRERELHTLLPSFSYLKNKHLRPAMASLHGIGTTLKNNAALSRVDPAKERASTIDALRSSPATRGEPNNLREALDAFLDGYATVVRVNILAAKALQSLERSLGGSGPAAAALATAPEPTDLPPEPSVAGLMGNALELADETLFFSVQKLKTTTGTASAALELAAFYAAARERGRLLTVQLVSMLRAHVLRAAKDAGVRADAYFCTIDELMDGTAAAARASERRAAYERHSPYNFPARLTHAFTEGTSQTKGVSAGIAEGTLATVEQLDANDGEIILCVQSLAPSLTAHFDRVVGIAAEHGGLLSHLAIVARERNLPVVVGFRPATSTASLGDRVRIDGTTGTVEKAPKQAP